MTNKKLPCCKEVLWDKVNGASTKYADIFVSFNRRNEPFIRCKGKTFGFTDKGFKQAMELKTGTRSCGFKEGLR